MATRISLRSPAIVALIALAVALVAILQVGTSFGLGPGSTYDASSSIGIFRNATIVTAVLFALTLASRWFAIPGMLAALFGLLAMGTFLIGTNGRTGAFALSLACVAQVVALWAGVMVLRGPPRPA